MALPMNSGAEAVETASRRRASGATRSRASPTARPRSSPARTTSTAARSRSSASRPTRSTATASARSRPASQIVPFGDAEALRAAITPEHLRVPRRADPGRGGHRHAAGRLPARRGGGLPEAQRPVHRRRDPVGPRPHRQAVRLQARRRQAGHRDHRQGAVGRLLPGLGGARRARRCSACSSPATTAARSAATRSRAPSRARRCTCSSTRSCSSARRSSAPTSSTALQRIDRAPTSRRSAAEGLWIGIEMTGPARPYCEALKDEGMLCKETHEHVIRFAPPLVITRDEIDWAVEIRAVDQRSLGRTDDPVSIERRASSWNRIKTIIMGAAGRDFHNFNVVYRDNDAYDVVAFTATQIPEHRRPAVPGVARRRPVPGAASRSIAEKRTRGTHPRRTRSQEVVFAVQRRPLQLRDGAAARSPTRPAPTSSSSAPTPTMIKSTKPVIAVCAVRTGVGQEPDDAAASPHLLREHGLEGRRRPAPDALRRPREAEGAAVRAASPTSRSTSARSRRSRNTSRTSSSGTIIYAGVDYGAILDAGAGRSGRHPVGRRQQRHAVLQARPHDRRRRPAARGQRADLLPGEANLRMADVVIINKVDTADLAGDQRSCATTSAR